MLIILDLCAGTGSWSRPYRDAGYTVELVDVNNGSDVRLLQSGRLRGIRGILAAPPCTYFCRMRMCRGRPTDRQFLRGLSVVDACLRTIEVTRPLWWALENPQGYLSRWLGEPELKFDPCDYGDAWTKRTWVWGRFRLPRRYPVKPDGPWIHRKKGRRGLAASDADNARTPPGFAQAFFEANP